LGEKASTRVAFIQFQIKPLDNSWLYIRKPMVSKNGQRFEIDDDLIANKRKRPCKTGELHTPDIGLLG
jgi:hypothetical protein